MAFALAASTVGGASMLAAGPAQAAPGDAFDPADPLVFVGQGLPNTGLQRAVAGPDGSVSFEPEGDPAAHQYNAIAYNTDDNYLYGIATTAGPGIPAFSVIRIGQDGVVTRVGTSVMPHSLNAGTFGGDGLFWAGLSAGATATTMYGIDPATGNVARTLTLSAVTGAADLTYANGFFWGANNAGGIVRVNPTNGTVSVFPGVLPTGGGYGAAWTFGNGNIGVSDNASGNVSQVSITNPAAATPSFRLISTSPGPASSNNDGASSPGQPTDLAIVKTGPTTVVPGETVTYTLTVTNDGPGNSSGFVVNDTVPAPLTNVASTSEGCTVTGNDVRCVGGRTLAGESVSYTVTASVPADVTTAVANTATVIANENDPDPGDNTSTTTADPLLRALSVTKTSDATAATRAGDTVTYTVTAENVGDRDYTADEPAVVTDDLSGVLDDATYAGDADADRAGDVTFTSPRLSWSGALPVGETVTLTYSVTLASGGDGVVRNVAFAGDGETPACDPPGEDGTDPVTGVPCATSDVELPRLSVTKTADRTELPALGEPVEYTVTVTNEGPGDYTVDEPATATDDLSDVLDDATLDEDGITTDRGEVTVADGVLTWSGPLTAGQSATITYTVTSTGAGDDVLVNRVCVPADQVAPGAVACDAVRIPAADIEYWKTVAPGTGTAVMPGQQLTYTLHFRNDGEAAGTVAATDDLSGVLDDADLVGGPTVSDAALTATVTGDSLSVTGSVPVGETITVSYTVQVKAWTEQGDNRLGNALTDPNGVCLVGECTTVNPVAHLSIVKTSDVTGVVSTGDTVTYTVTVTNDGEAPFTAESPASATDDLSGVLDDASYNDDARATLGDVSYAAPVLTWSGPLGVGQSASVTYSATVTNAGDHVLENTASLPAELCAEDCAETVTTDLPHVVPGKTADPATGESVQAGDVVTYTLTFTNDGTAAGPVDSTDDLSGVLDDAAVTSEPVSDTAGVMATRTGDRLRVVGELAAGATATVTYRVTVNPDGSLGDRDLGNVLVPDVPVLECTEDGCAEVPPPATQHPVGELDDWKTVDPASGTAVRAGQEITYTLHFANTGEGTVTVDRHDVLAGVLDDADLTAAPVASDGALVVSEVVDGRFGVTGTLTAGQEVTVSYTVTVRGDGERGDDVLGNVLVEPGQDPPATCAPTDDERPDCTVNYVSDLAVTKSADPEPGTGVEPGQEVTYTLTFTNTATSTDAPAQPVAFTDHMRDVLDDATLRGAPIASDEALAATVDGETISVTGELASGTTATVTYTVTVKETADQGNRSLGNVVAPTGTTPVCAEGSPLCTAHEVEVPPAPSGPARPSDPGSSGTSDEPGRSLATTGAAIGWIAAAAALLVAVGALALVVGRSRRTTAG